MILFAIQISISNAYKFIRVVKIAMSSFHSYTTSSFNSPMHTTLQKKLTTPPHHLPMHITLIPLPPLTSYSDGIAVLKVYPFDIFHPKKSFFLLFKIMKIFVTMFQIGSDTELGKKEDFKCQKGRC